MKFFSSLLLALPVVLSTWTAMAYYEDHDGLLARQWDDFEMISTRDYDEPLALRRSCKTSKDCLGMICINGVCQ
ncbi:hypothetical protein FPV67DRAFT_1669216 [Lyophyllum atratum]|nr:hypothetical protein FPV67DRAFT_1669216 [Lyophyllum atratum]